MKLIFDLLFSKQYSIYINYRGFSITDSSIKYILTSNNSDSFPPVKIDNYTIETAAIGFYTTDDDSHVITYFKCNDTYYIYDSNERNIYPFELTQGWQNKLIALYKDLGYNNISKIILDLVIYRKNDKPELSQEIVKEEYQPIQIEEDTLDIVSNFKKILLRHMTYISIMIDNQTVNFSEDDKTKLETLLSKIVDIIDKINEIEKLFPT